MLTQAAPTRTTIAIVGDFNPKFVTHQSMAPALQHAASQLGLMVESSWIPTPTIREGLTEKLLESYDGIWASPGSPYESMDGMLRAIQFARIRNRPFLGTCGGFQHALIEFARGVLELKDADSAEHQAISKNIVIVPVMCALPNRSPGGPKLSGDEQIMLQSGTHLHNIYGKDEAAEQYFCNYEVDSRYLARFESAGLRVAARGSRGEARAVELVGHQFFLASLFQPQLNSTPDRPHPILLGFIKKAKAVRKDKKVAGIL